MDARTRRPVFLGIPMEEMLARDLAAEVSQALVFRLPAMVLEEPAETCLLDLAVSCPVVLEVAPVELVRLLALLGLESMAARAKVQVLEEALADNRLEMVFPSLALAMDQVLTEISGKEMVLLGWAVLGKTGLFNLVNLLAYRQVAA